MEGRRYMIDSGGHYECPDCGSDRVPVFATPIGPKVWLHPDPSAAGPCSGIYRQARWVTGSAPGPEEESSS